MFPIMIVMGLNALLHACGVDPFLIPIFSCCDDSDGDNNPSSSFFEGASTEFRNLVEPGPEITSQPSQGVAPPGLQEEPYDPLAIKERKICDSIKAEILELLPIREELQEVEKGFPGITNRLEPTRALDHILDQIITSEKGSRGIWEGATRTEISCYKRWLNRVNRGTDPTYPPDVPQSHANDINIRGRFIAFYREYSHREDNDRH